MYLWVRVNVNAQLFWRACGNLYVYRFGFAFALGIAFRHFAGTQEIAGFAIAVITGAICIFGRRGLFTFAMLLGIIRYSPPCPTATRSGVVSRVAIVEEWAGQPAITIGDDLLRINCPDDICDMRVGDVIFLRGEFALFPESHGAFQGKLRVSNYSTISRGRGFRAALSRLRQYLLEKYPGEGIAKAIATGHRESLSDSLRDALSRTGTSHLVAISGLHVGIVVVFIFVFVRTLLGFLPIISGLASLHRIPPYRVACVISMAILIVYVFVVGARPAVLRASLFASFFLAFTFFDRPISVPRVAHGAFCVLLFVSPELLFSLSFQLSFLAVFSLLHLVTTGSLLVRSMKVTVLVTLATAPLIGMQFGEIPTFGILANVIAVPITEIVIVPAGFLALAICGVSEFWAAPFGWLAEMGATVVEFVVTYWRPPRLAVTGFQSAAIGGLFFVFTISKIFPQRRKLPWVIIAFFVGLLTVMGLKKAATSELRISFLDVGQGDSTLLTLPNGAHWLVDAGPSFRSAALRQELQRKGVTSIERVIITHGHDDHYGGLEDIAGSIDIGTVWHSGAPGGNGWKTLVEKLSNRGTRFENPPSSIALRKTGVGHFKEGVEVDFLWPLSIDSLVTYDDSLSINDNSIVFIVRYRGRSALFSGDIESESEGYMLQEAKKKLHADIVKVPHHGSRGSSSLAFVERTAPGLAVVSCGRLNRFGFPAREVVNRWKRFASIHRTDEQGPLEVVFTAEGKVRVLRPEASPNCF